MRQSSLLLLLGTLFLVSVFPAFAQETEEDPYADYSYLWESTKKKKKKKDRKKKQQLSQDTTVQEQPILQDTLKKKQPQDTLKQTEEPAEEPAFYEQYEEDTDATREKKEKREISGPPVEDFRSGMSSGGGGSTFNGGFTFTVIDDQYYVGMTLNPELNLGKVGLGLNIPVLYGLDDKSIRTEIFKDGVGVARLITYLRLGVQKADPVYLKVGQLNNTMIGFGGLVNNYTNTTSFEKRKVGLHYDFNLKGIVGVDGLYSDFNFSSLNLLAVRPYVRPLAWTPVPIIRTFEVGTTFIKDKDQTNRPTTEGTDTTYFFTKDGIGAFGMDAGVTLLRVPFIQIDLFATYSKLKVQSDDLEATIAFLDTPTLEDGFEDGTGASVGLNFRFHFIADILATDIRIERLNYSQHYIPQFFDANYEIDKDARILSLLFAEKMSGTYGSLTGHILKKVRLGGSLMIPDDISEESPATVRVNADLERLADKISLHGSYIKGGLADLGDAFKFDERSLAKMRFIYHMNKFLAVGMDYYWYATPTPEGDYKTTKYVQPYFGLSIAF